MYRRMDFSLRCAYAHGTSALRTHLINMSPKQTQLTWPAFARLRKAWAGRVELQGVSLVVLSFFRDAQAARQLADLVAQHGARWPHGLLAVGGPVLCRPLPAGVSGRCTMQRPPPAAPLPPPMLLLQAASWAPRCAARSGAATPRTTGPPARRTETSCWTGAPALGWAGLGLWPAGGPLPWLCM